MINKKDDNAFEISQIEQLDDKNSKIIGLTLITIKVGDTLYANDKPDVPLKNLALFEVTKIFVFGRELMEIDAGFYIELFVKGDNKEMLQKVKYLHMK